jgi:hypothetical protein
MGNVVRHLRNTGDKLVEVGGWNECGSASTRHLHPLDAAQLQAWSAWSSLPSVGAEIATNKAVLREAGRIVSDRVSMGLGSSASLSFAGVVLVTVAALGFLVVTSRGAPVLRRTRHRVDRRGREETRSTTCWSVPASSSVRFNEALEGAA